MLILPAAGHAAVSAKDIQVAARILGFTTSTLTGNAKMGVLFEAPSVSSASDEPALINILGSSLAVGNVTLVPMPISIDKLAGTSAGFHFLTGGRPVEVAKFVAQAGNCALNVQTPPSVQITADKTTTATSSINFASAFMLMITKI